MRLLSKYRPLAVAMAVVAMICIDLVATAGVSAQSVVEPCSPDQVTSTMSVVGNRLNYDSDDSVQIYVYLENRSDAECEISYELNIHETSGLKLVPDTSDWRGSDQLGVSLVLETQVLYPGVQPEWFLAELLVGKPPKGSDSYRLSGGFRGLKNSEGFASFSTDEDWRDIWVWGEIPDPRDRVNNCEISTPVHKRTMIFDGGVSMTPLLLSFDCEYGYSLLQASITGNEIDKMGFRLKSRNSVGGSGTANISAPYFASPDDKENGRYTIVFKGVPKDVPGLRLTVDDVGDHELVPADSHKPEDQAYSELTDAYEVGVDSALTTGFFVVFGVVLFALLWLVLVPPRLGGWASQKYQWKLIELMWTVMSLALIIGTFALVSWAISSFSSAVLSGNVFGVAYVVGSLLGGFGLLTLVLFVVAVTRVRMSASSNRRIDGTMLPWWLQNPLRTVRGTPTSGGQRGRSRRSGGQTYFGMLMGRRRARNGGRRNSGQASPLGWNWVVLLVAAGVASVAASALLTP